jgi:hypothetical protein
MASRVLQKGVNKITQGYKSSHKGVDLGRVHITGEPVIAHTAGKVILIQTGKKNDKNATGNASYGNFVKIDHGHGISTLYAHLANVKVKSGEKVRQGQVIGTMGNTGRSFGTHLHFEVRNDNVRIDPTPYLESDLPLPKDEKPHVTYKVYTNKWLPDVVDCNDKNSDGYAGINGKKATALMARSSVGVLKYRVHILGGDWTGWELNDNGYVGVRGKAIDAVQAHLCGVNGYEVKYRVSSANKTRWYGWCVGETDQTGDGYAGVFGDPIDCIQMKIEKVK